MTPFDNTILDNKYEIVHEIKRGGFGIVYFGLDKRLNKPIAIKKIVPELVGEENFLEMFHEEALNVAKLNHNNIVHIYDLKKTTDGHLYIIMEYIDGYDLERILRSLRKAGQKMSPYLAAYIIAEVCVALDYANQRLDTLTNKPLNLVHQDVSPSNIMITRHGGVKLIDFGISSVKLHQKTEKKSTKLRGKIPYMAPEQLIRGNIPDHRTDLFSLGLVLHEALSGQRIFNSREDVYAAGKNARMFKKAVKDPSFPQPLDKIISNALEPDIRQRYQSANRMHFDLVNYLRSRKESGEMVDYLVALIHQYCDRKKRPQGPPATPIELTLGKTSTNTSGTSKWSEIEIIEETEVNIPAKQKSPTDTKITNKTVYTTDPVFESDEYIRPVIDVIRASVRDNKNKILQYCFGFILILFVFGILDTINGWTRTGVWMRDLLFSPTIEIATIPDKAEFYLDGRKLAGKSPIEIANISPGVHQLEIVREGFKSIKKSLFVPLEGKVQIQGEEKDGGPDYLFRFVTEVKINSNPQGAHVYLNGVRLNQKTPCTIKWEAGTPFALELERPGFNRLTDFSLNGSNGAKSRRHWEVKVLKNEDAKYSVNGIFEKRMVLETKPRDVEIYDLKSNRRLIPEPGNTILLALGSHKLEFRKASFISKKLDLNITENSSNKIIAALSRNVRFTATSASGHNADIGANLISLKSSSREFLKRRTKTPLTLALPAYTYKAVFTKAGYQRTEITVGPNSRNVTVRMKVAKAVVDVTVLDALSGQPISGVDIYYIPGNNPNAPQSPFAKTDLKGRGLGQLPSGKYLFTVNYRGFRPLTRNLLVRAGESYALVFKIYPSH